MCKIKLLLLLKFYNRKCIWTGFPLLVKQNFIFKKVTITWILFKKTEINSTTFLVEFNENASTVDFEISSHDKESSSFWFSLKSLQEI